VSGDRELDVVVFGATGFAGRLVAGYLAGHAPDGVRIGLAGQSAQRPGSELIAAFGDDTTAVIMYGTDTVPVRAFLGAECVTVAEGKITRMRVIFDRLLFEEARKAAGTR
jgi:short subunit dehydrogenase-like uncharacterized protein